MNLRFIRQLYLPLLLIVTLAGCPSGDKKVDVSNVQIDDVKIKRYGQALFNLNPKNLGNELQDIWPDYYFFLGDDFRDTLNIIQIHQFITDAFNQDIAAACNTKYPNLEDIEQQLFHAFKYLKYYFPQIQIPQVYSYVSGLNYEMPVAIIDSVMIIALDMYLGADFEPYKKVGLPVYKIRRMDRPFLVNDCLKEMARIKLIKEPGGNTTLDQMIYHGKLLYYLDAVMPEIHDSIKIGYTENQINWCRKNESSVWAFIIERDLLFATDDYKINKLIQDGPFTSGLPDESPAMLGRWMGWQIVRSYMKKNKSLPISDLFNITDAQQILNESGYKPGR